MIKPLKQASLLRNKRRRKRTGKNRGGKETRRGNEKES